MTNLLDAPFIAKDKRGQVPTYRLSTIERCDTEKGSLHWTTQIRLSSKPTKAFHVMNGLDWNGQIYK